MLYLAVSVTRCWNKKWPQSFSSKSYIFQSCPNRQFQNIWTTFARKFCCQDLSKIAQSGHTALRVLKKDAKGRFHYLFLSLFPFVFASLFLFFILFMSIRLNLPCSQSLFLSLCPIVLSRVHTGAFYAVSCCVSGKQTIFNLRHNENSQRTL